MSADWKSRLQEMARTNPALLEANPQLREVIDPRLLPDTPEVAAQKAEGRSEKAEKRIQQQVEAYCLSKGFYPRTEEWIYAAKTSTSRIGWQFHLHSPKRNPYMLDVMVWIDQGPCTEFELKAAEGALDPRQRVLVESCGNPVFWNTADAIEHVRNWMIKHKLGEFK